VNVWWGLAALVLALGIGVLVGRLWRRPTPPPAEVDAEPDPAHQAELERILAALPGASIVVDASGTPVRVSKQALALTLVQNGRISIPDVTAMVADVRRDGIIREHEMTVLRPPLGKGLITLRLRVAPLGPDTVLVLAEDLTEASRVDAVRRDFVANVSHELKTPIGALSLLAEAVLSSAEEPEAVRHFAGRMEAEAGRLSALVGDLIDLSRLQGEDPLKDAEPVSLDAVIAEAVDAARLLAQTAQIEVVVGGTTGLQVLGVECTWSPPCATCSPTPSVTARVEPVWRWPAGSRTTSSRSASPTRAWASRRTSCTACSSASTAWTRPARGSPGAPAWVCRS